MDSQANPVSFQFQLYKEQEQNPHRNIVVSPRGARHGLNMTAKLARVREQELLLLQEWGGTEQGQDDSYNSQSKKKKVKKSKHVDVGVEMCVAADQKNAAKHKKKKKSKKGVSEQSECTANTLLVEHENVQVHEASNPSKKKKKRDKTKMIPECEPELYKTQKKKKKKHDKK